MSKALDPEHLSIHDSSPAHAQIMNQPLLKLVDQSLWANCQWVEFVYAQRDPESRPRELLSHIMLGERVWFERIEGPQTLARTFELMGPEELVQGFQENAETYRRLIGSRLPEVIDFRRASGEQYHARVEDILHHLLTHGYHHRGQLAAHYARAGVEYPNTDHINYLLVNGL